MLKAMHKPNLATAKVAVSWSDGFAAIAQQFAQENNLAIINELPDWRGLCFHLDDTGWALGELASAQSSRFIVDFQPKHVAQGKDPLLKAMAKFQTVLDITAGWGGDALHIACSGRKVVAVERNPVVAKLLMQAHEKLKGVLAKQLRFLQFDATSATFKQQLFAQLDNNAHFDLVYMDPMFPDKEGKHAKSKKPMRLMQTLTDEACNDNEKQLFYTAMSIATQRVVVKRALKAPFIANEIPQGSIKSKLLRFDLYKPYIN